MRALLAILILAAAAPAVAGEPATLHHVPPPEAPEDQDLALVAVIDDAWREPALEVHYRALATGPAGGWRVAPFERSSAGGYYATLPADVVRPPGLEYYVAGHFASLERPHRVRVEPEDFLRWTGAERVRLGGKISRVSLTLEAQDFGSYHRPRSAELGEATLEDRHVRGEVAWTHRLVSTLYAFSLGYGFLEGTTTSERNPAALELTRQARYGFGGVRLRLAPWIWVDGRAVMGFSHDGFITGAGGALTLGRPWLACVTLGAEAIQDLGPKAWLRLQWDTVAPLIMGATISVTEVPDAGQDGGNAVAFDVTVPVTDGISVTGVISYAARDHYQGGPGVGFSTAFEF